MKPALLILFFTGKLFACANIIELASAVVNFNVEEERLEELRELVTELEGWDRFLNGRMGRLVENEFLLRHGQGRTSSFLNGLALFEDEDLTIVLRAERKEQFRRWLLSRHGQRTYQGGFRLGDYLGNFDVMTLFEPSARIARIESLRSLLAIQEFNCVLERELERVLGKGQVFRRVHYPAIHAVVREASFRVDVIGAPSEKLIRFAEVHTDKPASVILQRYRLLVTAFNLGHLATVGTYIDTMLAQKNIRLTPGQKHFQRFKF